MTKKNPKYIYHYTKSSTAIVHILPKKQLLMSSFGQMNDAKENLLHRTNPELYLIEKTGIWWDYWSPIIAKKVSSETKVLCFSTNRIYKKTKKNAKYEILGCFLQRMWAQYGDNNGGVCFIINYEKFIQENATIIKKLKLVNDYVFYDDQITHQIQNIKMGVGHLDVNPKEFTTEEFFSKFISDKKLVRNNFFCKNTDWSSESEYRFLAFSNAQEPIYLSIENSLEKVALGIHFLKSYLPSIEANFPKDKILSLKHNDKGQLIAKENF